MTCNAFHRFSLQFADEIALLKPYYLQSQTTDEQNSILSHRPVMYLGITEGNIQDHANETAIF
jgi:hypothetical protein